MPTDQYEFGDPRSRYPNVSPEPQTQPEPGLQSRMTPVPDLGEDELPRHRPARRPQGARSPVPTPASAPRSPSPSPARAPTSRSPTCPRSRRTPSTSSSRSARRAAPPSRSRATCGTARTPATRRRRPSAGLGGIDVLVNVAGKQVAGRPTCSTSPTSSSRTTFDVNVFALFWLVKAALPHLQPGATIINTASMEAYKPAPDRLDYAATKGAINNFSKGLAQLLVERGIRVNVVAPGPTWSVLQVTGGVDPESLPEFGSSESPMGRAGQPAELAPAYVFLASQESSFVAGETLNVNGGMVTP